MQPAFHFLVNCCYFIVILVMFGSEMNTTVPFMAAAHSLGYTADPSFVFIIFSLLSDFGSPPWDTNYDGMSYPFLRAAYEGAYIIAVAGQDYISMNTFRQKLLASQNYTNPFVKNNENPSALHCLVVMNNLRATMLR